MVYSQDRHPRHDCGALAGRARNVDRAAKHRGPHPQQAQRAFAWLARNRRLSKDYELKVQTSEAFIDLAAIRLMLKRLAPR